MSPLEKIQLQQNIAKIICQSRFGDELFLIDYDMAASKILEYLQGITAVVGSDQVITMDRNNTKAA